MEVPEHMTLPIFMQPHCANAPGTLCTMIFDWTHNAWLADYSQVLIAIPLKIVVIVLVAIIVRYFVHHAINGLTRGNGDGKTPKLLRPLRERANELTGPVLNERRRQRARTLGSVLRSLSSFIIFGFAVVYILNELSVNLGPVLASAGVLGVAIGFGAQTLVRDFLSGMFMMVEDQYGVGDVVDVGVATGTVETVGLRVTTLRDGNGTVWYVRNGEIKRVGNSSQGFAVAVVDLPISHTSNVEKAMEVAGEVAKEVTASAPVSGNVLEPPEMLGIDKITPDMLMLRLTVKVRPGQQWAVQRALRAQIKRAYDDADIQPPYPSGRPLPPVTATHQVTTET